jgi:hypothetical protein
MFVVVCNAKLFDSEYYNKRESPILEAVSSKHEDAGLGPLGYLQAILFISIKIRNI